MIMVQRERWVSRIETCWRQRTIVWLSGVRRIGKSVLCRQLERVEYFNCDLPSVQRQLTDPEVFLRRMGSAARIVLDEVHRLPDPSMVLKIAADAFPRLRILAIGSSTLAATRKFRDSLSGRKRMVHLLPALWREASAFGIADLDLRLLRGGFPEVLLGTTTDPAFFEEWLDSFYARDIQELFGVRNRSAFLGVLKLALLRSSGQLDISDLAKEVGISRPTVMSHLDSLEIAHAILRVSPFHRGGQREILNRPKLFGFDTGLIAHVRGWTQIRDTDRGHLWEHLVLDELRDLHPEGRIRYWRDKSGREIDFVIDRGSRGVDTLEAKVDPGRFDAANLEAFRSHHPIGRDFVVCPYVEASYVIRRGSRNITVCGVKDLPTG
ncbi:MAG: ATP-binding protein [Spirochaetes bacterium]|nr:ATP-binding protein [Spirochaetota bacterium]